MKKNVLVGNVYGRLTVIKEVKKYGKRKFRYLCKCECGNNVLYEQEELNSGTISCGCVKEKSKNIIGNKYGILTVIGYYKNYIKCRCECGNEITTYKSNLINGVKSCGCLKKINHNDLINKKYGKLTVIEKDSIYKGIVYYKCDCDCGNKNIIVSRNNLISGNTKSCGCLRKKQ